MEDIIAQIPFRHNWIACVMLIGVFQAFFMSLIILGKSRGEQQALTFYGWLLLLMGLIAFDVYLCYTGWMVNVLHFNDSTEPLVLALGPLFYLSIRSLMLRQRMHWRQYWFHFLVPGLYFLSQIFYYAEPLPIKLNAYLGAYYSELPRVAVEDGLWAYYQPIKDELRWLILFQFLLYIILSARVFLKAYRSIGTERPLIDRYIFSRDSLVAISAIFIVVFSVFLNYENDHGDHYIILLMTAMITYSNYAFLSESRIFSKSWIKDKYETSGIGDAHATLFQRIEDYVTESAYYLESDANLKTLAARISVAPNYVSQAINSHARQNFNDYLNAYRIKAAQSRLLSEEYQHLNIEGIGHSVGFKSKSSFYTAFRKFTEMTPSAYIKAARADS